MTINLGGGGQINLQQWQKFTPDQQAQLAATLGFDPKYVDTQLKAGEQVQGGPGKPSIGGEAPSSTLPNLTTPNWSIISPESFALVQEFVSALGYSAEQAAAAFSGGGTAEEELSFVQQAIEEYTSEEGGPPQVPPESAGSGESPTPSTPGITLGATSGLNQLWSQISTQIQAGTTPVPANYADIAAKMSSQNPDDVNAAILQLADLSNLTPDQQTFITGELSQLSSSIASSIASGGSASFFIRLGVPELLTLQFATALGLTSGTTMSSDNQTLLLGVLTQLANKLSDVNFKVATGTPNPSPEYQQLTSQDPAQVTSLLTSIFNSVQLPEGSMTDTEKSALLSALVTEFTSGGTLPTELSSSNEEVVSNYLSQLIEKLGTEGKLSPSDAATLAQSLYLIPALASQIASINQTQCINDLYSSDPTVISSALHNLGNVSNPPSDEDVKNLPPDQVLQKMGQSLVMGSYLNALVKALAFLAQIRALINQLEGTYSQELANAKLSNIADQVQTALAKYQEEIDKIKSDYSANLKAIQKQKLMKWLMPFITILVTVIMTIVSVLLTICSGGILSGLMFGLTGMIVAKIIVAAVMITVAIAMAVLSIVDAARSIKGDTEIWTAAAQSLLSACKMKNQPQWLQSLISAVLQTVIAVFIALFTLGAGIGASLAMISESVGKMALVDMTEVLKQVLNSLGSVTVQLVMMCVITPIMSSGVLNQAILEILKACGSHNDKTNAIITMIISIITMIAIMLIGVKVQGSINSAIKGTASQAAPEAAEQVAAKAADKESILTSFKNTMKQCASEIGAAASAAGQSIDGLLKAPADAIKQLLQAILQSLRALPKEALDATQKILKQLWDMFYNLLKSIGKAFAGCIPFSKAQISEVPVSIAQTLQYLTQFLQIATHLYEAVTDFELAKIYKELADLNKKVAALESSAEFLQMMSSGALDSNTLLKDLAEDAKGRADDWTKLVNMVASYITDASKDFSQLIAKGSFSAA